MEQKTVWIVWFVGKSPLYDTRDILVFDSEEKAKAEKAAHRASNYYFCYYKEVPVQ